MKRAQILFLFLATIRTGFDQPLSAIPAGVNPRVHRPDAKSYDALPLNFVANTFEPHSRVDYETRGSAYSISLARQWVEMRLTCPLSKTPLGLSSGRAFQGNAKDSRFRMLLHGSEPGARGAGLEELPGKVNYLVGNDPTRWHSSLPTFAKVAYADIYPGVDVVYYGNHRNLEFDFVVRPGADPNAVRLKFEGDVRRGGHVKLRIDPEGKLLIRSRDGEMVLPKPVIYQELRSAIPAPERHQVDGEYVLTGNHEVGFKLKRYDKSRVLIIDPTVEYSTLLGGNGPDEASAIAVDSGGNVYIAGYTGSSDFPTTTGGFGKIERTSFITKFNAAGTALVYSTYLGGTLGSDEISAIAVDRFGNAFVTGMAISNDFPTTPLAFQRAYSGNTDAFVSKLSEDGSALLYSTFLNGSSATLGYGIAVDAEGNAYVTGETLSPDFPTTVGAYQPIPGVAVGRVQDAFVSKFNSTGSVLLYSTYLGLTDSQGNGIAVDLTGSAYVAGWTNASFFPTTLNAFAATGTGFVTKFDPGGSRLIYSTRLQGSQLPTAIAVDSTGDAYVAGSTSCDLPVTQSAYQCRCKDSDDAFVAKLNRAGSALVFSTYLGGSDPDQANGIALSSNGDINISGYTSSQDFPTTKGAFQTAYGGGYEGAFFAQLNATGSRLLYSTFLGSYSIDNSTGIAVDSSDNVYVTGYTFDRLFPTTPNAYQRHWGGGAADSFVVKFSQ